MKVLIVDDSSFQRNVLKTKFLQHSYETFEARDGQEGLDMAAANTPDLIISDILMPHMDGFQFLRNMKKDERLKGVPFIFYSATYSGNKEVELADALGAVALIERKRTPEEFWNELCMVLDRLPEKKAKTASSALLEEDEEYLSRYIEIVNAKLEKKVDELEKTKDELFRTREKLEHLLAYSPAIIYSAEATAPYAITFISENVTKALGYTVQECMESPAGAPILISGVELPANLQY